MTSSWSFSKREMLTCEPNFEADDGLYALKKVVIQTEEQLELVKKEIHATTLFNHPNLLPLIDHAIISVKVNYSGLLELL